MLSSSSEGYHLPFNKAKTFKGPYFLAHARVIWYMLSSNKGKPFRALLFSRGNVPYLLTKVRPLELYSLAEVMSPTFK